MKINEEPNHILKLIFNHITLLTEKVRNIGGGRKWD